MHRRFDCSECGVEAGVIEITDGELVRTSFTSVMRQTASARIRELLPHAGPAELYALDPELVPFWCPECARSYCKRHWSTWNVYDDETEMLDCIRGTCLKGHERMLED